MTINHKNSNFLIIGLILILVIVGVYLNRAYAHIYNTLGAAELKPVDYENTYYPNSMAYINNIAPISNFIYSSLGDSLTAGVGVSDYSEAYPYLVAVKLEGAERKVVLKNHSIPGATTVDLVNSLLPAAINDNPDIVTLLIGVNDLHNRVSLNDFKNNYEQILSRLTTKTKAKIYIISIPFIGANTLMWPPYQFYFNYQTKRFNLAIQELARKYKVNYLDLYTPTLTLFKKPGNHYSPDLFHPSAAGYKIWADIIYDNLNK